MGAQHTPGPWRVNVTSTRVSIVADDVAPFSPQNRYRTQTVAFSPIKPDSAQLQIGLANARLIAAAPDMLDVLEHLVNGTADIDTIYEDARSVITKATGGQHD